MAELEFVNVDKLDFPGWYTRSPDQQMATLDAGFVESVRQNGVITPIEVVEISNSDRYLICNGVRRVLAAIAAGHAEVPYSKQVSAPAEMETVNLTEILERIGFSRSITVNVQADGVPVVVNGRRRLRAARQLIVDMETLPGPTVTVGNRRERRARSRKK
jgi:hypothetical protein